MSQSKNWEYEIRDRRAHRGGHSTAKARAAYRKMSHRYERRRAASMLRTELEQLENERFADAVERAKEHALLFGEDWDDWDEWKERLYETLDDRDVHWESDVYDARQEQADDDLSYGYEMDWAEW